MPTTRHEDDTRLTRARVLVLALTAALVISLIGIAFPADQPRLEEVALERLSESGVDNPVTAVLLNFRGYDTLLEVAVLFLTVISIWSMARRARVWIKRPDSPVLATFVRFLLPIMMIVAGYLLWLGADAPGGAFQGGAVLGGMGILLVAAAVWTPLKRPIPVMRVLTALGLAVFSVSAVILLLIEGAFLRYPSEQAKALILLVESAATISIGITLTLLFIGGIPRQGEDT